MNNTTNSIKALSGNTITHLSWIGSILGFAFQIVILYIIFKKINLNAYVKTIYCILCCYYIVSHLLTFVSFIPILYLNSENWIWCAILRYFATTNGHWIQSLSALLSVLRFYMGWCTSQNRIYRVGIWKFPPTLKLHNFKTDLNFGAIFLQNIQLKVLNNFGKEIMAKIQSAKRQ